MLRKEPFLESQFGDGLISESQRLAEIVVARTAAKSGIILRPKYWEKREWKSLLYGQMAAANKLLERFSFRAVYRALTSTRAGRGVYSLRAPFFHKMVVDEQRALDIRRLLDEFEPIGAAENRSNPIAV